MRLLLLCCATPPLGCSCSQAIRQLELQHSCIGPWPPLPPQGPGTDVTAHDGAAIHGYLNTVPVLEQIYPLPHFPSHLAYAPVYASNGALAHMHLGPMHATLPRLRS
ncbi:hypothetical protein L3X38_006185 [Prunus dulcis]|uniref:Secreted protein n=1 Tax=Prunus dulcis TaxID=3755 RepID=A0AAD4ZSF0_PRUDU|nr:hypothetical protein L3X38_006185 [Prunus dulcis]